MSTNLVVDYPAAGINHWRSGIGARAVQQLSDGSWVCVTRQAGTTFTLRRSTDRVTWTLLNSWTVTSVDSEQWFGLTIDFSNNLHFVHTDSGRQVKYQKLTYAAGPTYTVGAEEVAIAAPAGTEPVYWPTVECLAGIGIVVACVSVLSSTTVRARIRVRTNPGGTWGTEFVQPLTVTAGDGQAVACNIARDMAGDVGGSQKFMLVACGGRNSNFVYRGYSTVLSTGAITAAFNVSNIPLEAKGVNGYAQLYSSSAGRWRVITYQNSGSGTASASAFEVNTTGSIVAQGITNATPFESNVTNGISGRIGSIFLPDRLVLLGIPTSSLQHYMDFKSAVFINNTVAWTSKTYKRDTMSLAGTSSLGQTFIQGGDANRNINGQEHLIIVVNQADGRVYSHFTEPTTIIPTNVGPAAGSVVSTDIPTLKASISAVGVFSSGEGLEWGLATDTLFSVNVRSTSAPVITAIPQTVTLPVGQQLFQGSWYVRARATDILGQPGSWTGANLFTVAHQPSAAPTNPASGITREFGAGNVEFQWSYSDPSPVDSQTAYQIIVERNSDGVAVSDSGKVVAAGVPPLNPFYGVPMAGQGILAVSGTYKDVLLRWKVRVWDTDDVVGPYSSYATFQLADAPVVSITSPSPGAVVDNPQPLVTWSFSAGGGRTQVQYRVVFTDTSTSAVVHDSGVLVGAATSYQMPRSYLTNTSDYSVTVYVTDSAGLSDSESTPFATLWTPPPSPSGVVVSTTSYEDDGYVLVSWDETIIDVDFYAWRVYRRIEDETDFELVFQTTDPGVGSFNDWVALSGHSYEYSVVQVANRFGSLVESDQDWQNAVDVSSSYYWLIHPDDNDKNIRLYHVVSEEFGDEYEESTTKLIGRGNKVDYGTHFGKTGTLTCQIRNAGSKTAREIKQDIEAIKDERRSLFLRNPFGDVWQVAMGNLSVSRVAGTGQNEYCTVTIPYTEVA